VFLTNPEKTEFVALDTGNQIGELLSFTWSPDGEELAIVGNTTGSGTIYVTDPTGGRLEFLLSSPEAGHLRDAAWSRDGKQFIMWSSQNKKTLYLLNADGTQLVEKALDLQIFGPPRFAPDGNSIILYGADASSAGLFEVRLENSQPRLISALVEDETGYAFSPDGSRLAYVEMDRDAGEARLVSKEVSTGGRVILGMLPIPKGSGSSIPESRNLSWSADGKSLVFDFGRNAADSAIYLAYADGSRLVKIVEAAYAPSISADGKCLAYISADQVFLMDLSNISVRSTASTPVLLADLPTGRGTPNFKQDQLQWSPASAP
jgi:Tol biopolymer transport system component